MKYYLNGKEARLSRVLCLFVCTYVHVVTVDMDRGRKGPFIPGKTLCLKSFKLKNDTTSLLDFKTWSWMFCGCLLCKVSQFTVYVCIHILMWFSFRLVKQSSSFFFFSFIVVRIPNMRLTFLKELYMYNTVF